MTEETKNGLRIAAKCWLDGGAPETIDGCKAIGCPFAIPHSECDVAAFRAAMEYIDELEARLKSSEPAEPGLVVQTATDTDTLEVRVEGSGIRHIVVTGQYADAIMTAVAEILRRRKEEE